MKWIFLLSLSILLLSCGNASEENELMLQKEIDSLETEILELQQANDTLSDHLMKKAYLTKEYPPFFDSIAEPEVYLLEKLRKNSETIPKKAVLGGTMRFTSVSFINEDLIIAEYEDGHIMGKAIYRYTMDKRGNLTFNLVGTIK